MPQQVHVAGYMVGAHDRGACAGSLASVSAAPDAVVMLQGSTVLSPSERRLLWLDAAAGAAAGMALLVFRDYAAAASLFPVGLVVFNALANLAYASFAGTLATLTVLGLAPPRRALATLVAANAAWPLVCVVILSRVWGAGSAVGLAYVALEALFVGSLAFVEYRVFFARRA